jgi:hypothetical protein
LAPERLKQRPLLEGPVGDDGDTAVPGQWQEAPFSLPVHDVVGELHEVDGPAGHDLFYLVVAPSL